MLYYFVCWILMVFSTGEIKFIIMLSSLKFCYTMKMKIISFMFTLCLITFYIRFCYRAVEMVCILKDSKFIALYVQYYLSMLFIFYCESMKDHIKYSYKMRQTEKIYYLSCKITLIF